MMLKQVFRTQQGAMRRAMFETAHCDARYRYDAVRFLDGERDMGVFDEANYQQARYTWRLERTSRAQLARERDAGRARYAHVAFPRKPLGARA